MFKWKRRLCKHQTDWLEISYTICSSLNVRHRFACYFKKCSFYKSNDCAFSQNRSLDISEIIKYKIIIMCENWFALIPHFIHLKF